MAGIAGIYCADGRPADVAELKRMTSAVQHRGPDGITYWNSGPVALAHLQFHTTPESLDEHQPLPSPGGEACLTWNGRIDNRDEILEALTARGVRPVDSTDAGLALSAYLLWGTDCLQRLVGDFAFAIWDARHRQLWCARDYIGIRPFYYFWNGKTFLFGPEIRALLAHPLVSLKVNEGMAGEYLANAITSRDETLYADIRRLPGGSHLTIDGPGSLRIQNWWNPELGLLHYRNDEEYGEHFRVLFDQAVRSQLRSQAPVGVALSGGLDSSSIAVTAQELLRREGDPGRLYNFSLVSPGKSWDESEDIDAIVQHAGLQSERMEPLDLGLAHYRQRAALWREFPGAPNGEPMSMPMCEALARRGGRVLITGLGGDEWLQGHPEHVIDLALAGHFRPMLRRARNDWYFYSGAGRWQTYFARHLLKAAVPDWALQRRRSRRLARTGIFSQAFLRRTKLAERLFAKPLEDRCFSTRTQQAVFRNISDAQEGFVLESNDRDIGQYGAEIRFPFHDRRLAEFCLRLPEGQRQQGFREKWALRTAMRGRLPEPVQKKEVKAEFSDVFANPVREMRAQGRLENMVMIRHTDWLDRERFAGWAGLSPSSDPSRVPTLGRMWMVLGVDLWAEGLFW